MTKREKTSLRQDAYSHSCLGKGGLIERLRAHWGTLFQIEYALRENDADRLRTEVEALDVELIRYALGALNTHLNEAAIRDCGVLLAERVFDLAPEQPSLDRWKDWLSEADFWPSLAEENWMEATARAADEVLSVLDMEGVVMDDEMRRAIYRDVRSLQIRDLIPQDLADEIFLSARETDGNDV
jgi:hypothetical protein